MKNIERGNFRYYCNSCGNTYFPDSSLNSHISIRPSQLPYELQRMYWRYWHEDSFGLLNYVVYDTVRKEYGLLIMAEFMPDDWDSAEGGKDNAAFTAAMEKSFNEDTHTFASTLETALKPVNGVVVYEGMMTGDDQCNEAGVFFPASLSDLEIMHAMQLLSEVSDTDPYLNIEERFQMFQPTVPNARAWDGKTITFRLVSGETVKHVVAYAFTGYRSELNTADMAWDRTINQMIEAGKDIRLEAASIPSKFRYRDYVDYIMRTAMVDYAVELDACDKPDIIYTVGEGIDTTDTATYLGREFPDVAADDGLVDYTVSMAVDGRIDVTVRAKKTMDKAELRETLRDLAETAFMDADLSTMEVVGGYPVNASNENGDLIFDF